MADSKANLGCDLCQSKFTQKGHLKQHYISFHKLKISELMATSYSTLVDSKKPERECQYCRKLPKPHFIR